MCWKQASFLNLKSFNEPSCSRTSSSACSGRPCPRSASSSSAACPGGPASAASPGSIRDASTWAPGTAGCRTRSSRVPSRCPEKRNRRIRAGTRSGDNSRPAPASGSERPGTSDPRDSRSSPNHRSWSWWIRWGAGRHLRSPGRCFLRSHWKSCGGHCNLGTRWGAWRSPRHRFRMPNRAESDRGGSALCHWVAGGKWGCRGESSFRSCLSRLGCDRCSSQHLLCGWCWKMEICGDWKVKL